MRQIILTTLLSVLCALASVSVLLERSGQSKRFACSTEQVSAYEKTPAIIAGATPSHSIKRLQRYDDPDYGFSLAVPEGWTKVVANDRTESGRDDLLDALEQGYAIGFESPQSDQYDRFADYILIEVLPGVDSGLFHTTLDMRHFLQIGHELVAYDRLDIDGETDDLIDVDLVIFQRGIRALGYTLSFYAVGEPANEEILFAAFQIMLRTYIQNGVPFEIL